MSKKRSHRFFKPWVYLTVALMLGGNAVQSLDESPWLGNFLEFDSQLSYESRRISKIDQAHKATHYRLHDRVVRFSLSFMPDPKWDGECEVSVVRDKDKSSRFNAISIGLRRQWLDDVALDPITLTTGLDFTLPNGSSVNQIGLFFNGHFETQGYIGVGKEFWVVEDSYSRIWAIGALGVASRGSPFARLEAHIQRSIHDTHFFEVVSIFRKGFGNGNLRLKSFSGYGSLDYHMTEVGAKYAYRLEWIGDLSFQYLAIVNGKNAPKKGHSWEVGFEYPFGL